MQHLRISAILIAALLGCGESPAIDGSSTKDPFHTSTAAVTVAPIPACTGLPAGLAGAIARSYPDYGITVNTAPAYPKPGEAVFVTLEVADYYQINLAQIRYTTDGWKTQTDLTLTRACNGAGTVVFVAALGNTFASGTRIELAAFLSGVSYGDHWYNNNGANYVIEVQPPRALAFVGDTHLRHAGRFVPADLVTADNALEVYTQTYPMGAAKQVELFYADAAYGKIRSLALTPDVDFAGASQSNSQWRGTIPASDVKAGQALHYWIRAEGFAGVVLWDSAGGANFTVVPAARPVGWIGGFGAYGPVSGDYQEGALFNVDGSTATGCWNHGASMSSYRERAVRIYVPGITDRNFASSAQQEDAAAIIHVEAYTNATADGTWKGTSARFFRKEQKDFIYGLLPFTQFCNGGGPNHGATIANGSYGFKVRASTDEGQTWFWRGSDNGPAGGKDLPLAFAAGCSYFNDANNCIP